MPKVSHIVVQDLLGVNVIGTIVAWGLMLLTLLENPFASTLMYDNLQGNNFVQARHVFHVRHALLALLPDDPPSVAGLAASVAQHQPTCAGFAVQLALLFLKAVLHPYTGRQAPVEEGPRPDATRTVAQHAAGAQQEEQRCAGARLPPNSQRQSHGHAVTVTLPHTM